MRTNTNRPGHPGRQPNTPSSTSASIRTAGFDRLPFSRSTIAWAVCMAVGGIALAVATPKPALAQAAAQPPQGARQGYTIPAGPLAPALRSLASSANLLLTFTAEQTSGRTTAGINGHYTAQEALAALLVRSGLQAVQLENGGYVLRPAAPVVPASPAASAQTEPTLPAVRVTADPEPLPGELPKPYAGGKAARGSQFGLLGNRDYMDTPFSSASFTRKAVQDQQAQSVTDVIANDPSVKPIYGAGGYYDSYLIRGMPAGIYDVAFNGIHGIAPSSFIAPQAYERIELTKGPALLLTGFPGALGGIVNVIPKRATDEPVTQLTTFYSSTANVGAHADVGRRFGNDNEWGIRVNGMFRDGNTAIDHNKREVGLGTLAVDYRGNRVRFSTDIGYQLDDTRGNRLGYTLAPGNVVPGAPSNSSNAFQRFERARDQVRYGLIRGEVDLSDSVTAYAAVGAQIYSSFLTISNPVLVADGSTTASIGKTDFQRKFVTREAGIKTSLETGAIKHGWSLVASDYKASTFVGFGSVGSVVSNIYSPILVPEPEGTPTSPRQDLLDVKYRSVAIADVMSMLDDSVQLILGGRQQHAYQQFFGEVTKANKFSPSAGVVYKPMKAVALYANYVQSLEIGPTAPLTAVNAGAALPAALTKSKEVGIKLDTGALGGTLALFELTRQSGGTDPVTNVFGFVGLQRNRGAELTVFGEPVKGVRVMGGATWLQPILTKSENPAVVGNDAAGVPRTYVSLGTELDLAALPGTTAIGRIVHSGSSYLDAGNEQKAPGWTRFDLGARHVLPAALQGRPVTLRADLLNAFNKRYWQTDVNTLLQGTPRALMLSATFDF